MARKSTKSGTKGRKEARTGPPLDPTVSKGIYTLCYYLAFGSVYASHLAMEFIPENSVIRHGLRDGAQAARAAWARSHEEDDEAESEMELPDDIPEESPT